MELKSCNYLDMGCGIGSVLLMLAWAVPKASCLGIEAQEERKRLAEKSIKYNGKLLFCRISVFFEWGNMLINIFVHLQDARIE